MSGSGYFTPDGGALCTYRRGNWEDPKPSPDIVAKGESPGTVGIKLVRPTGNSHSSFSEV
jgi:hypothetical protein